MKSSLNRVVAVTITGAIVFTLFVCKPKSTVQDTQKFVQESEASLAQPITGRNKPAVQDTSSIQKLVKESEAGLLQPIAGKVKPAAHDNRYIPSIVKESKAGLVHSSTGGKKPTDCCKSDQALTMTLEELCKNEGSIRSDTGCECTDFMLCKIVVVTGFSSNHFMESKDFFGSIYKHMPNTKIIVFNLGLKPNEVKELKSYCSLEVRDFQFDHYPKHMEDLYSYAFKPLMLEEISKEYELILYCDASCRLQKPINSLLKHLVRFPLVGGSPSTFPMTTTTHDGMLKYLKLNYSRAVLSHVHASIEANSLIMWFTALLKEKIMKYWVDCALHRDCIAPQGSSRFGCGMYIYLHPEVLGEKYAGCHRYDQSAINLILFREFGLNATRPLSAVDKLFKIERKPAYKFSKYIKKC